ncbi:MAG: CRISPR-associated endonuclease Cas2 [Clostridia bacterium]|jgi:CRISPR-associated protein Cas2
MFIVFVYDVNEKRVNRVLKCARKYLTWVQNSVLEGEISNVNYIKLKEELKKIINDKEDSLIFYTFRTTKYSSRESIGLKKGGDGNIL